MAATEQRLVDLLPGVLRGEQPGERSFVADFLDAFERIQRGAHAEVEHVPDLFSLAPTPSLRADVAPGRGSLGLDSAAGIRPGDLLEI